jgi:hypothetical protein
VAEQFPDWDELPDRAVLNGEVVARSMTGSGGSSSPVDAAVLVSSISVWWLPFSNGAGAGAGAEVEDHAGVGGVLPCGLAAADLGDVSRMIRRSLMVSPWCWT